MKVTFACDAGIVLPDKEEHKRARTDRHTDTQTHTERGAHTKKERTEHLRLIREMGSLCGTWRNGGCYGTVGRCRF